MVYDDFLLLNKREHLETVERMKSLIVRKKQVVVSINHTATGKALRAHRIKADVGLRELARRMSIPASYLSDLETGRRNWSESLVERFLFSLRQTPA